MPNNARDIITDHFASYGHETNAPDGLAAFAWDYLDATHAALVAGSGEQFDQLAKDIAYSVEQEGHHTVSEADAKAWILDHRDRLLSAVSAALSNE